MFKFDFEVEDSASSKIQTSSVASEIETRALSNNVLDEYVEISLLELLDALPPAISYSRLIIPSEGEEAIVLPRRDLYDARFQLISLPSRIDEGEDTTEDYYTSKGLYFVDAPSDLVPGVYEGGLKTWECSIDLVAYLASLTSRSFCHPQWIRGKHVLEVGCGTAIPTLYVLHQLFNYPSVENEHAHPETVIHLQDYNRTAIELMTLPNILLTWYLSRASTVFRDETSALSEDRATPTTRTSSSPTSTNRNRGGEIDVEISPELIDAFRASLHSLNITLRFFTGSWKSLLENKTSILYNMPRPYDIVLTSETIYRQASLDSLIGVLSSAAAAASHPSAPSANLPSAEKVAYGERDAPWCLVAAKVVYFGVGGGVNEFLRAIKDRGEAETVWDQKGGVGRVVMRIHWNAS